MDCENCGRVIDRPYHSGGVQAVEQVMITNPDGSGQTWTPKAIIACSWPCLAVCVEATAPTYDETRLVLCTGCGYTGSPDDCGCEGAPLEHVPLFTRRADVRRGRRDPDTERF